MNNIKIEPLFRELKQVYDKDCWVVLNISDSKKLNVFYFNNAKAPEDYKYEDFLDFAQSYMDDNFSIENREKTVTPDTFIVSGTKTYEEDDYDEDSGRSYRKTYAEGQIIEIYKSFKMNQLSKKAQEITNALDCINSDAISEFNEELQYHRDIYAYHGVSRRDFF